MKILDSTRIRFSITFVLMFFVLSGIYIFLQPKPKNTLIFLKKEYTFSQAQTQCTKKEAHLPRLGLLIQLARFDMLPHPKTDYWSSLAIYRYAFGWSTRTRMLSFDPHDDTDHVVCVQEK